jgi:two-component system, NarL family, response regulator NreC
MVRVFIVDDHAVFRLGVRHLLGQDQEFQLVGEAASARAGFALVEEAKPDVVLMDVALPGMDGFAATRELKRRLPDTQVLMLTVHDTLRDALEAFEAGATGFAAKSEAIDALLLAMRTVARGERYVTPRLAEMLDRRPTRPDGDVDVLAALSAREREVFHMASHGVGNDVIARELCISRKTVETHRYRIQKKLGLRTGAEVILFAATHGFLRLGPGSPPTDLEPPHMATASVPAAG